MSAPVSLDELARRLDGLGPLVFLLTTDGSSPHVVSALVEFDGARFSLTVGRTSGANMESTGRATLLWPEADDDYSLIVDGDADVVVDDEAVRLRPTRAVLHRRATASTDLPSCIRIEA